MKINMYPAGYKNVAVPRATWLDGFLVKIGLLCIKKVGVDVVDSHVFADKSDALMRSIFSLVKGNRSCTHLGAAD